MRYSTGTKLCSLLVCGAMLTTACTNKPLEAPAPPPIVQKVADNWSADQAQRIANKSQYIRFVSKMSG